MTPDNPPPQPTQDTEIRDGNGISNVMSRIAKQIRAGDIRSATSSLPAVNKVSRLISDNTPPLAPEVASAKYGFISPAHLMASATAYVEQCLATPNLSPNQLLTVAAAADQAKRLAQYPDRTTTREVTTHFGTRSRRQDFTIPTLIEIPKEWRDSPNGGEAFRETMASFLERRTAKTPVGPKDMDLLKRMSTVINTAFDGHSVSQTEAERYPDAVNLIQIHIALVRAEAEKCHGRLLPSDAKHIHGLRPISGLFYYSKESEIQQQLSPEGELYKVPKFVASPSRLRT